MMEAEIMAKTVLIIGASSGIGEAIARRLLADGYIVFAGARRPERMTALREAGAKLIALDVTDEASMSAAIQAIVSDGGLDVLVNNAGYGSYGSLEEAPPEEGRRQFEVNVFGLARLTQLVLPTMRSRGAGRIVNIASIGGKIHEPFGGWRHASKFAVEALSDCLRMETRGMGVDVIVIESGAIKTEWNTIARDNLLKYSGQGAYRRTAQAHGRMLAAARPRTRYATGSGVAPRRSRFCAGCCRTVASIG